MNSCEHLKKTLVDEGPEAARRDETLAPHLRTCPECSRLLKAWKRIPDLLDELPEHEPDEKMLQKVLVAAASGRRPATSSRRRFLVPSLASAAVLLAAIGLSRELLMHESPGFQATPGRERAAGELLNSPQPAPPQARRESNEADQLQRIGLRGSEESVSESGAGFDTTVASRLSHKPKAGLEPGLDAGRKNRDRLATLPQTAVTVPEAPAEQAPGIQLRRKADIEDLDGEFKLAANEPASREYEETTRDGKSGIAKKELTEAEVPASSALDFATVGGAFTDGGFDFLRHYRQTENLRFQAATGYWANTYVPGDPEIRLLSARLAQWDRSWLENNAVLEQDVVPVRQPFDAPADNALALSLMADASAVTDDDNGATRMRLQVGIRGIEHRRGQRPAMNVGIVVDLPADAPDADRIAARALLDALLESRQAGDRFSLVMTGAGLIVPPPDFRFGSLQLAKQHILGQEIAHQDGFAAASGLELFEALQRAGAMVRETDDPGRPLGSSSVLLISANSVPDTGQLAALAHENAKEGITLSVFPLGKRPQNEIVEKLVLAGLGNRRYLETPAQAGHLIEDELHASSRAVARAARLSIRLAPGVRLIGVVGSERLDTQHAQRVRDIENSMDRRLSVNLGIQADRGEDEDGIQIVIPSVFSGDSVTVLLDVVADRPGAVADVSLRYKDLVFLRNGSLQGHLELPKGENKPGPAELAVLKNLLSHHFVEAVEQAAAALGRQQPAEAIAVLNRMRSTIDQARRDLPAWANDPDLVRDSQVLDRYIAALTAPRAGAHQPFLADSLRYAAWAKTHRPLAEYVTRSEPNERSH
jgi:hypothetical protein